jgi:hypothetical protein
MTTDPSRIDMRFSFHEVIGSLKILSVILFACGLSVALKPVTLSACTPMLFFVGGYLGPGPGVNFPVRWAKDRRKEPLPPWPFK